MNGRSTRLRRIWITAACLLAAAAGVRCVFLFARFWNGGSGVQPHHLQSAAVVFVALGAIAFWIRTRDAEAGGGPYARAEMRRSGLRSWLLLVVGAVILYAPAISSGFLSDDFVLQPRARDWQLGAASSVLFRPLTMAMWAALQSVGAAAVVFHLVNITLHATAGFLTMKVAAGWVERPWAGVLAGFAVVAFPIAVEPVAWVSGAFDVSATTLVLAAVLVARRYDNHGSLTTRALFYLLVIAAVLSKETAVVAGLLVLVDRWVQKLKTTSGVVFDAVTLTVTGLVYGWFRLQSMGDAPQEAFSRYVVQRGLFQTFGSLSQQWPGVTRELPAAAIGVSALVALLVIGIWTAKRWTARPVAGAVAWILISVAPVFTWVVIGPNLDQSRYLYLAAPAWAMAIAAVASGPSTRRWRMIASTLLIAIVVLNGWAVRRQLRAWTAAAALRDRIIASAHANADARACGTIRLDDLPDSIDGAYLFRNGATEAFAREGVLRLSGDGDPPCRFRWDGTQVSR